MKKLQMEQWERKEIYEFMSALSDPFYAVNDRDDTVPRISWGRFAESDGRKSLTISMEVNHRLIDGYHIGQFEKHLTGRIAALQ